VFKQALALCFVLVALSHAKVGPEIESISDLSHCDRIPAQYRDLCASSIKAGYPFTFKVLESTPNKVEIEPVPLDQSYEENHSPRGNTGRDVVPVGQQRAEERNAAALEDIAISTAKMAESSRITAKSLAILAGIQVAGVVLALVWVFAIR
jgi:hypothetical protein